MDVAGKSGLSAGYERAVLREVGYVVGYSSLEGEGIGKTLDPLARPPGRLEN